MKKYLAILLAGLTLVACSNSEKTADVNASATEASTTVTTTASEASAPVTTTETSTVASAPEASAAH